MNEANPNTVSKDEEQLRLLAIFHYIVAAMVGLFSLFPIIHLVVGVAMVTGEFGGEEFSESGAQPPVLFGWFFIGIAVFIITFGLSLAAALAISGRSLQRRERYTFSLVVAAISCIWMPFGTVLGVFTIIVLMRESVRVLYGRPIYTDPPPRPPAT